MMNSSSPFTAALLLIVAGLATLAPRDAEAGVYGYDTRGTIWDQSLLRPGRADGYDGFVYAVGANDLIDLTPPEAQSRYSGYNRDTLGPQYCFTVARLAAGVPSLRMNYQLSLAAQALVEEMFRQGWIGLRFPDGKSITWALQKVGYAGDIAKVSGFVWWDNSNYPYGGGSIFDLYGNTKAGKIAKAFPQIMSNVVSMGVGSNLSSQAIFDDQRTVCVKGLVQVLLLSTEPTAHESRALFDDKRLVTRLERVAKTYGTLSLTMRRGLPATGSVVVLPNQLASKRIRVTRGRLPVGVRIASGRFVGAPKRVGNYRCDLRGDFRVMKFGGSAEGRQGQQLIKTRIRVTN